MIRRKVETLKAVRDLISDPDKWTKGALARGEQGKPVNSRASNACRFCLFGAIDRITQNSTYADNIADEICVTLAQRGYLGGPVDYNDSPSTKHPDILDLVDSTIERLQCSTN